MEGMKILFSLLKLMKAAMIYHTLEDQSQLKLNLQRDKIKFRDQRKRRIIN